MGIIIFVLLVCTSVLGQDTSYQYHPQQQTYSSPSSQQTHEAQKRLSASYATSIVHGDAKDGQNQPQSSVKVFHSIAGDESVQLPAIASPLQQTDHSSQQIYYQNLQHDQQQFEPQKQVYVPVLQFAQQPQPIASPLTAEPPQQSQQPQIYQFTQQSQQPVASPLKAESQQEQLYNVGYSINIENSAPKLTYRLPNPPQKNAHSYRQQKLLNADVITGTNKDIVSKPSGFAQNYVHSDQSKELQTAATYEQVDKQALANIFSNVRNTHGYTWKTLSPGVEISGYHSLNGAQQAQSHTFDHAAALGRSQGFDISNVVESGKKSYQGTISARPTEAYNINQGLSSSLADTIQTKDTSVALTSQNYASQPSGFKDNANLDLSSYSTNKYIPSSQNSESSFDLSALGGGFQHNLIPEGNIDFDKSLFDTFYKNYKPDFYPPEVTLPSPNLPNSVTLNLKHSASHLSPVQLPGPYHFNAIRPQISQQPQFSQQQHQFPQQQPQFPQQQPQFPQQHSQFQQQNLQPQAKNPQFMVNQHYAFVQAEGAQHQVPQALSLTQMQNDDVKPVQEPQQEPHVQPSNQHLTIQKPGNFKEFKEFKGKHTEHKKYFPQNHQNVRAYGPRSIVHHNDKNYRLKTNLRPPSPMIIVHQKY